MNLAKLQDTKSIHRNHLHFYILTIKKNQREIKESTPFTTATKRIKYLGINLPKETKELYTENYKTLTSLVAQTVKASGYNVGDLGFIPGLGRSPGEGNGNPLQYSCLENPMDRGAWWAAVHGVAKTRTRLSNFTSLQ